MWSVHSENSHSVIMRVSKLVQPYDRSCLFLLPLFEKVNSLSNCIVQVVRHMTKGTFWGEMIELGLIYFRSQKLGIWIGLCRFFFFHVLHWSVTQYTNLKKMILVILIAGWWFNTFVKHCTYVYSSYLLLILLHMNINA